MTRHVGLRTRNSLQSTDEDKEEQETNYVIPQKKNSLTFDRNY